MSVDPVRQIRWFAAPEPAQGTGETARVVVIAAGPKAAEAEAAGADFVGSDELIAKIAGGWTDFDAAVATPDMMGKVGRLQDPGSP